MLLKADADRPEWSDVKIAEAYDCRVQTVETVRKRLVTEGFEVALERKKRSTAPTPHKLDGVAEAKLIAMRLGKPPAGYGRWSGCKSPHKHLRVKQLSEGWRLDELVSLLPPLIPLS